MTEDLLAEKYKKAAAVVCRQGMVQFPVSDTAIAIIKNVVGENGDELDLMCAFHEKSSQVLEQLVESSKHAGGQGRGAGRQPGPKRTRFQPAEFLGHHGIQAPATNAGGGHGVQIHDTFDR